MNAETFACACADCAGSACTCGCQDADRVETTACNCGCAQGKPCRCAES